MSELIILTHFSISVLTIRKISFRNIRSAKFPSRASLATPVWHQYQDQVEIPALVLMESMQGDAAQVVFLSMRNIDKLLVPHSDIMSSYNDDDDSDVQRQVVNSQVMHVSFSERSDLIRPSEPVSMMFEHQTVSDVNNPRCVLWDRITESWSGRFCDLVYTNTTHTQCQCSRVGTFGLLEDVVKKDSMAKTTFLAMVIIAVAVSSIVVISVVLVAVYCYRIKVR